MRSFILRAGVLALAGVVFSPLAVSATIAKQDARGQQAVSKRTGQSGDRRAASGRRAQIVHANLNSQGKRKGAYQRVAYASALAGVPPMLTAGDLAGLSLTRDPLDLNSNAALVLDHTTNEVLFEKNAEISLPIASITKLMTSLMVVEADQDLDEVLTVTEEDVDREKFSHSRLRVGSQLSRANMLHIALMSSENRAASALGRHYPGGIQTFVTAMNTKARELGMTHTRFSDSTGLSSANVSSARDLAKLVLAAYQHPLIRQYSTARSLTVQPAREPLGFYNTNRLVSTAGWSIGMQKTGFISEAGNCLVMIAQVDGRQLIFVLLDAAGKLARFGDAQRIRGWVEKAGPPPQRIHAESTTGDAMPLRVSHNDR